MGKAYLYLVLVILLWALTPVLVVVLAGSMTVHQMNFLATGLTLSVLAVTVSIQGKWARMKRYTRRDWLIMLLLGAAGIFPFKTFYYLAFALVPGSAGELNIINFTWPVLVVLLSPLILKERMTVFRILGAVVSFTGAALIVSRGWSMEFQPERLPAYLCMIASAIAWGLFSIFTKKNRFEALTATFVYNLSAFVCFGGLFLMTSTFRNPSLRDWALLMVLGGGATGVGYLLWIIALRLGDTAKVSHAVVLIPFVTLIYLAVLRGERIRFLQIAALGLIIAGAVIQHLRGRRVHPMPPPRG